MSEQGAVEVLEAGEEDFDARVMQARDRLVVVDFWGPRCPNCEVFAADLDRLLESFRGSALRIVKVDAYTHSGLAKRFALFGVPTFILVRDGKVLGKMSQYHGFDYWSAVVREHLSP